MSEEWRPVPGTDGAYEVSTLGQLRRCSGRLQNGHRTKHGYFTASINGKRVFRHVLVALAFHGEPESGQEVRHLNGVAGDDRPENLAWGTRSENVRDAIEHRTHNMVRKSACKWGHDFTPANTFIDNLGRRICRTCKTRHMRAVVAQVADRRREERAACLLASPDRVVYAVMPDGSELVSYRRPRIQYFREWPLSARRNRVRLPAREFHPLLRSTRMEDAS